MDVVVAQGTASSKESSVDRGILVGSSGERRRWMSVFVVALLAQPRLTDLEEADIVAPVRLMTVEAAFANWGVFPQERAPLVGVTPVATLVDAVFRDEFLGDCPVHVMTTGTLELAFPDRHVGPVHLLGNERGMALLAQSRLVWRRQLTFGGLRRLYGMAGRAGHVAGVVLASLPEQALSFFVALQARAVSDRSRLRGFGAEPDTERRVRLVFHVLASRTVTRLAVVLLEGGPTSFPKHAAVQRRVHLLELILVALLAGLAPHVGCAGDCGSGRLRRGSDKHDPCGQKPEDTED